MEISDIQLEDTNEINKKVVITFYNSETMEDVMELKISKKDAQQIGKFCVSELNYGAQLKKATK